jgi:hypothetical protein
MMFLLQSFGVIAGGLFTVAFVKGFVEAMVDDHRRRKRLLKKLEGLDPPTFPTKPPELKVVWPENDTPPRRKRAVKKKTGARRG